MPILQALVRRVIGLAGRSLLSNLWMSVAVLQFGVMSISLDEVRHVARLARIELDDVEVLALQGELNALLGHFADIQAIDARGIEPTSHAVTLQNVWEEDIPRPGLPRDRALKNSALTKAGLFVVPTIIED